MDQQQSVSVSRVLSVAQIAGDVFDLRLETEIANRALPGQFVGVYTNDETMLLPRPVSVCDASDGVLRLVFRVAGRGTQAIARIKEGGLLRILGPLGNGYPAEALAGKKVLLFGGGIGIPPMLYLAKALAGTADRADGALAAYRASNVTVALGYRTPELFLADAFSFCKDVLIACETPCGRGIQGNAVDAAAQAAPDAEVICACGPKPMLTAVRQFAGSVPAYLSLEERMACGIGACLACTVKTPDVHPHTHVRNARVCTDGPVFRADTVLL